MLTRSLKALESTRTTSVRRFSNSASLVHTDLIFLARILRYLATRHVFKEISPDVFVNNRLSSALKKAKSLKEIKEK
jgi:hypothetical protein